MKITKNQLKQIINEEIDRVISEASGPVPPQVLNSPDHDVQVLGDAIHYMHSGFSAERVPQNMRKPLSMVTTVMWETDYNPEEHKQGGKGTLSRGVYILDPSESHMYNKYMQNNPGMKGPTGGYSVWPLYTLIEPSNGDRVVFFSLGPDRDDTMMARGPA